MYPHKLDWILNAARNSAVNRPVISALEELQWYEGWANEAPLENTPRGICTADWNEEYDCREHDDCRESIMAQGVPWDERLTKKCVLTWPDRTLMRRLCAVLERCGFEIDWCDQVSMCDGCNRAVQTEPGSYSWEPQFHIDDGGYLCNACWDDEHPPEDEDEETDDDA